MKQIRISQHAIIQLARRGSCEEEVRETIQTSKWEKAELNKLECRKNFKFNSKRNDKFYATKQVRPIFVEEEKEIVIVTVYVYYF